MGRDELREPRELPSGYLTHSAPLKSPEICHVWQRFITNNSFDIK